MGEQTTGPKGNGFSIAGGYANGPLSVSGGYTKLYEGHAPTNKTVGNTADADSYNIGASYDFGVAKAMFVWNEEKLKVPTEVKFSSYLVGLTAPVVNGVEKISYQDLDNKTSGFNGNDASKFSVGYVYHLSKRTALYGTVAHISNDGGAAISLAGTAAAGKNSTGYEFGLRHSF
jgi:predicted porin